jgi:hypothetical protein
VCAKQDTLILTNLTNTTAYSLAQEKDRWLTHADQLVVAAAEAKEPVEIGPMMDSFAEDPPCKMVAIME